MVHIAESLTYVVFHATGKSDTYVYLFILITAHKNVAQDALAGRHSVWELLDKSATWDIDSNKKISTF